MKSEFLNQWPVPHLNIKKDTFAKLFKQHFTVKKNSGNFDAVVAD